MPATSVPRTRRPSPARRLWLLTLFALSGTAWAQQSLDPKPRELVIPAGGAQAPMLRCLAWAVIEGTIDGRGPYKFVVDTGASGVVLNAALASELALPTADLGGVQVRVAGPGGSGLETSLHEIESLKLGPVELRGLTVLAAELPFPKELAGVIGMAVFADGLLTFDYPAGLFRFENGELPAANQRDIFDIELNPRGSHPRLPLQLCGRETAFTLDTGMNGWFRFPIDVADACGLGHGPVAGPKARTVDREHDTQVVRIGGDVQIGKFTFERPHGMLNEAAERSPLIGAKALENFALTLDARRQRLRLTRSDAQPITPPPMRVLGFMTRSTDKGHEVWGVMPDSPAAKAGVENGDVVLECAGRPMDEWHWEGRLDELVKQPRVKLKLRRGDGEPREITFDVLELTPAGP